MEDVYSLYRYGVVLGTHTGMYFSKSKKHRLHSPLEKSLIEERIMQYYKDRIECFEDDYYPCTSKKKKKKNCDQGHMYTIG